MSKYIIKNCPCFNEGHPKLAYYGECLSLTDDIEVCQDCTDCLLKQIYKLCKDVLKLLDIEEVE